MNDELLLANDARRIAALLNIEPREASDLFRQDAARLLLVLAGDVSRNVDVIDFDARLVVIRDRFEVAEAFEREWQDEVAATTEQGGDLALVAAADGERSSQSGRAS